MDIRSLRYFVAVAENRSFSLAASSVGVVQSAMSHRIRALEDEVGIVLFDRDGRSIRLTAAGHLLLGDARRILQMESQARDRLKQLVDGEAGRLQIGFQSAACRRPIVSESLNAFRTRYSSVELGLAPMMGLSMEEALLNGKLDGALLYFPGNPALSSRRLYVDDWLLALPNRHRLAGAKSLRLRDLQSEDFIVLPRKVTPLLYDRIFAAFSAGGLTPRVVQEAFEEPMVLNLVAVGLGVAFVLDSVPTELHGHVVLKRVKDFSVPTQLCFVWNPENGNPVLGRFLEVLDQVASAEAAA